MVRLGLRCNGTNPKRIEPIWNEYARTLPMGMSLSQWKRARADFNDQLRMGTDPYTILQRAWTEYNAREGVRVKREPEPQQLETGNPPAFAPSWRVI